MTTLRPLLAALLTAILAAPASALHESQLVEADVDDTIADWETPAPAQDQGPVALTPFILDPGHGGEDLGAVVYGRREKDLALQIALKVKERLEARTGIPARMTRDSDVFLPLDARVDASRAGLGFVSLHLNQVRSKKLEGITIYAFGKSPYKQGKRRRAKRRVAPLPAPPKEQARASAGLAETIARSLRGQGFKVEPPLRAGFYVLKNPAVPSVLIELGYMSNPAEGARLADPAYQERLADALASSLQAYAIESAGSDRETARRKSAAHGGR